MEESDQEAPSHSETEPEAPPESPFDLNREASDAVPPVPPDMAEDSESDTRHEATEPDEELVESGEISPEFLRKLDARMAEVEKEFKPVSFTILDDPPPHEGKMFDYPLIVDAPDLIQVEVLEALPGRPISGERLVRPDGTICLDFYGDVYVRGLTPEQVKTRIILRMRKFLTDEVLGLIEEYSELETEATDVLDLPPVPSSSSDPFVPVPPRGDTKPGPEREEIDFEKLTPKQREAIRDLLRTREQKKVRPTGASSDSPRRTIRRVTQETSSVPRPAPVIVVPTEKGNIKVTIEVEGDLGHAQPHATPVQPHQPTQEDKWGEGPIRIIHPSKSDRVFVDVTAYNHAVYYVQGDVPAPGRLPCTGNETVLDAINYAGGLISSADTSRIRLVRPGQNGKPSKIYSINYNAILNEGDAASNLQLFPGDRLIVGRKPVVESKPTAEHAHE